MPFEVLAYIVIMVILACGSMLGHSNTLMLVFSLMAGPFILNGWVVYAMLQRVSVERKAPASVGAGETFSVQVTLTNNRKFLSCRLMRVEDTISNQHEELQGRVLFFRVPVQGSRTSSYRARLLQRGVYALGPTLVSSRFPFGLGERGRYFETPDEVLVHPQVGELSPSWWRRVIGDDRMAMDSRSRSGVFDDEFSQVREYRAGDPIRAIHWRTSARTNELMVREFDESREHDAVIAVDLSASDSRDETEYRTELAASFVATVCHHFAKTTHNSKVAFFLSGAENVSIIGRSSPDVWRQILDALARCSASQNADRLWLAEQLADVGAEGRSAIYVTTRDIEMGMATAAHVVVASTDGLRDVFQLPEDEPVATIPEVTA